MKKIISLLVTLLCAVSVVSAQTYDKDTWKSAKKTAKVLEKEGWVLKDVGDIAMHLYAFQDAVNQGKYLSVVEEATSSMIHVAEDMALANAVEAAVKQSSGHDVDDIDKYMRHSFTLLKFGHDGNTTCRVYYLLDKKSIVCHQ